MLPLPYVREYGRETQTRNGYTIIDGINHYVGVSIRDKLIFKIDLIAALTDCFGGDILQQYREPIFMVVSGQVSDPKQVSAILEQLYNADKAFRTYFGTVYYFQRQETFSMYDTIVKDILKKVNESDANVQVAMKEEGCRYMFTSSAYSFYATADTRTSVKLPKGYKGELVSNAKIWYGFTEEPR